MGNICDKEQRISEIKSIKRDSRAASFYLEHNSISNEIKYRKENEISKSNASQERQRLLSQSYQQEKMKDISQSEQKIQQLSRKKSILDYNSEGHYQEVGIIEEPLFNPSIKICQSQELTFKEKLEKVLYPQIYLPSLVHLLQNDQSFTIISQNRLFQQKNIQKQLMRYLFNKSFKLYIEIFVKKEQMNYQQKEYFISYLQTNQQKKNMQVKLNNQNYQDIIQINEPQSYLIQKLSISFEENRFKHPHIDYENIINSFFDNFYNKCEDSKLITIEIYSKFKLCYLRQENDRIIHSKYFDTQSQIFFNTYTFFNEQEFKNSQRLISIFQASKLLKDIFCEPVHFDQNNRLIFEESFDLSIQSLQNFSSPYFNINEKQTLLLQLIDIALLLDELGLYYNEYDIQNVGINYKESKSIIKLRKIFVLKQSYKRYVIKNEQITWFQDTFNKKQVLYYEICSILNLVQQLKTKSQNENENFNNMVEQFINNQNCIKNGISQLQVVEFFEKYYKNNVLEHYPILNMQYLDIFIKDYKYIYTIQLKELLQEQHFQIKLFKQSYPELEQNFNYRILCYVNVLMINLINTEQEQFNKLEENLFYIIGLKMSQQFYKIFIITISHCFRLFLLNDYKQNMIEQLMQIMLSKIIQFDKIELIEYVLDSLTYIYLKNNEFQRVIEILNIIANDIKLNPNRYGRDIKQQIILIRYLVYLLQKKDIQTIQNQQEEYEQFMKISYLDDIDEYQKRLQERVLETIHYFIPYFHIEILIFLIKKDYIKCQKQFISQSANSENKELGESDIYNLLDSKIIISKISDQGEQKFERKIKEQTLEEKQKYELALNNLSQLLYIDIHPLILHEKKCFFIKKDYGLTKEYHSFPIHDMFEYLIDFSNIELALQRQDQNIYTEKEFNQEEITDFIERIEVIINYQKNKFDETNEIYQQIILTDIKDEKTKFLNLSIAEKEEFLLKFQKFIQEYQYLNQKKQQLRYLFQSISENWNAYFLKDTKYSKTYQMFALLSTEQFYQNIESILSINKNEQLTRYITKIAHIDYDKLNIFTINGEYTLQQVFDNYKRENTFVPEKTIRQALTHIFKILFFFVENKYYIYNFDLDFFSLFKSKTGKNKYYIKYSNVVSITTNVAFAISELKSTFPYIQENQNQILQEVSDNFYLLSTLNKICLEMIFKMVNFLVSKEDNYFVKDIIWYNNYSISYYNILIQKMRTLYSTEFTDFFEYFTQHQLFATKHSKNEILRLIKKLFLDWDLPEKQQLIHITKMEQHMMEEIQNNLNIMEITQLEGLNLDCFVPQENLIDQINQQPQIQFNQNLPLKEIQRQSLQQFLSYTFIHSLNKQLEINNIQLEDKQLLLIFDKQKIQNINKVTSVSLYNSNKNFLKYLLRNQNLIWYNYFKIQLIKNEAKECIKNVIFYLKVLRSIFESRFKCELVQQFDSLIEDRKQDKNESSNEKEWQNQVLEQYSHASIEYILIKLQYQSANDLKSLDEFKSIRISSKYIPQSQQQLNIQYSIDFYLYYIRQLILTLQMDQYDEILVKLQILSLEIQPKNAVSKLSYQIFIQQLNCISLIMLNQNVEQQLKVLENVWQYRYIFQQSAQNFIQTPQKQLLQKAQNAALYYLKQNPEHIDFYSKLDIKPKINQNQFFKLHELYPKVQEIKIKKGSPLQFFSKQNELIEINKAQQEQEYQEFIYLMLKKDNKNLQQKQQNSHQEIDADKPNYSTNIMENNNILNQIKQQYIKQASFQQDICNEDTLNFVPQQKDFINQNPQENNQEQILINQNQTLIFKQQIDYNYIQEIDQLLEQTLTLSQFIQQNKQNQQNSSYRRDLKNYTQVISKETEQQLGQVEYNQISNSYDNTQIYLKSNMNQQNYNGNQLMQEYQQSNQISNQNIAQTQIIIKQEPILNEQSYPTSTNSQYQSENKHFIKNSIQSIQISEDNVNLIDENNFLKLGVLGQGGQGSVEFYYDMRNKKRYALKFFQDQKQYESEKQTYLNYLSENKDLVLSTFICNLVSFKDESLQLLFEIGVCSLDESFQILKQEQRSFTIKQLTEILKGVLSFNILMNKKKLYHGDIKPHNMVIYQDEDELATQQKFGFELTNLSLIYLKLIDFGSCSNDLNHYYDYITKKYKYFGYLGENMDWNKVLFAETYSACRVVYFLLDEETQKLIQNHQCDIQYISSKSQDEQSQGNLFFFLSMFLQQNQIQSTLVKNGISIELLSFFIQKLFGQISEINQPFTCDFLDILKRGQWKKVSEVEILSSNSFVEYKIISAFSYRNRLQTEFSQVNLYCDDLSTKIFKVQNLIENLEIIATYDSFTEQELDFIEKHIVLEYHVLTENTFEQFFELACFLYSHSQKYNYVSVMEIILAQEKIKNNLFNQYPIFEVISDIFSSILYYSELDIYDILKRLFEQQKSETFNKCYKTMLYEFIFTKIFEFQAYYDELSSYMQIILIQFYSNQIQFKKLNRIFDLLNNIVNSSSISLFQKKFFIRCQLFISHLILNNEDEQFYKLFVDYKNICRELTAVLEVDTIMYYNYHIKRMKYFKLQKNINKVAQKVNTSKKIELYFQNTFNSLKTQDIYLFDEYQQLYNQFKNALNIMGSQLFKV